MVNKFYAVAIGRNPGIYSTWNEAKEQVNGFKGAKYKSFLTNEEAQQYILSFVNSNKTDNKTETIKNKKIKIESTKSSSSNIKNLKKSLSKKSKINDKPQNFGVVEMDYNTYKKLKKTGKSIGMLEYEINENYDDIIKIVLDSKNNLVKNKLVMNKFNEENIDEFHPLQWNRFKNTYYIFTDGSFQGGTKRSGYGIYFGESSNNISVRMPNNTTNNYCEMLSIYNTLRIIDRFINDIKYNIVIVSDSKLCIKSLTDWCYNWIKNGWKLSSGGDVKNKELVKKTFKLLCKVNNINLEGYLKNEITKKDILEGGIGLKHGKLKVKFLHQNSHLTLKKLLKENPGMINDFNDNKLKSNVKFMLWLGNEIADKLALGEL